MEERKVQKFIRGEWTDCHFSELKDGDLFRLFEATGEPVIDNRNKTEFVADGDAFTNDVGAWEIYILK